MAGSAWKQYFTFTKKERTGVLLLLVLIAIIYAVPEFLPDDRSVKLFYHNDSLQQVAAKQKIQHQQQDKSQRGTGNNSGDSRAGIESELSARFVFDPNTLQESGWQQLGVNDRTIRTIMNFRSKGGKFRQPTDLRKIYGMNKVICEELIPFVRIQNSSSNKSHNTVQDFYKTKDSPGVLRRYDYSGQQEILTDSISQRSRGKKYSGSLKTIDINAADSATWERLPGIGSKLASRIMLFRDRLGGFYAVHQVAETFGISDSAFKIILPYLHYSETLLRKIDINQLSASELARHPYIRWTLANAIVNYRNQHGSFRHINDLKLITAFTPSLIDKLEPYLVAK